MYLALRVFFVAFAVIFTAEAAEIVIPKIHQKIVACRRLPATNRLGENC